MILDPMIRGGAIALFLLWIAILWRDHRAVLAARVAIAMRRAGVGHLQLRTDRDWVADIARFVLNYRRTAAILHQPPQGVSK